MAQCESKRRFYSSNTYSRFVHLILVCIFWSAVLVVCKPASSVEEESVSNDVVNMAVEDNPLVEDNPDVEVNQAVEVEVNPEEEQPGQGNEAHDHTEGKEEECLECKEAEEKARQEAEQQRQEDIKKFEEEVRSRNVHDASSRAIAEHMKNLPFEAGNMEDIMHGGHHVHSDAHGPEKPAGVDLSDILDSPQPESKGKQIKPGTLDADEIVHYGDEGHDHGSPHEVPDEHVQQKQGPLAETPDDLFLPMPRREPLMVGPNMDGMMAEGAPEVYGGAGLKTLDDLDDMKAPAQDMGIDVERLVHGDDHVHDHDDVGVMEEVTDEDGTVHLKKLGKQIKYEDILALGLSKDDLKGIDIGKLLSENEAEYDDWQKENRKEEEDGNQEQLSFWDQLDALRQHYFGSGSKKVKAISKANADDVEWDAFRGDDDTVHEGETQLEHDMELWGSTVGKNNRKPYKEIRGEDL